MDEDKTLTGQWWLPDQPDVKVFGTLSFNDGEYPVLSTISEGRDLNQGSHSIILGSTENEKNITLYRCQSCSLVFIWLISHYVTACAPEGILILDYSIKKC